MLFVTVGTDSPFDRLISAVDRWAGDTGRTDIFAQVGSSNIPPSHIAYSKFLEPPEFRRRFIEADLIVAHAGMGTILSALRYGKPILVMPRRAALGEQRNDHQLATARRLQEMAHIEVAMDETELRSRLGRLDELRSLAKVGPYASSSLIEAVRHFIVTDAKASPAIPARGPVA